MVLPTTPYYLLDEARLAANLAVVDRLRERSGARALLALKCFASCGVAELLGAHLDGTTSSSVHEARLGHDEFAGEVHAYAVAYSSAEVAEVATFADKVILNSVSQLLAHRDLLGDVTVGLRVNPGVSHSHYDLADPARAHSRLGVSDPDELAKVAHLVSGLMFHFNCENDDVDGFIALLEGISDRFATLLTRMTWISLGGGIAFTAPGYPVDRLADALTTFAARFGVQVYLEPGEAVVTGAGELVTTVLDVVHNAADVAIVDASVEAHLLDHLIYGTSPRLTAPATTVAPAGHRVIVAGRTCLAGDVFGDYLLERPLAVGDEVRFGDAAGYSIVKKSWFNGVPMPAIVVRRLDGTIDVIREFGYADYRASLS
jgi:carboxynorspermidine decarboxylase